MASPIYKVHYRATTHEFLVYISTMTRNIWLHLIVEMQVEIPSHLNSEHTDCNSPVSFISFMNNVMDDTAMCLIFHAELTIIKPGRVCN